MMGLLKVKKKIYLNFDNVIFPLKWQFLFQKIIRPQFDNMTFSQNGHSYKKGLYKHIMITHITSHSLAL